MARMIIVALMVISLSGCWWNTKPRIVKVPVFQCPTALKDITRPQRPQLLIEQIDSTTSSGETVKLYKGTILQLMEYSTSLEGGFDAYNITCSEVQ